MSSNKKKMNNRKFRKVFIPIITVMILLSTVVTVGTNYFSNSLDTYLGRGERIVDTIESSEDWDLEFYNQGFTNTSAKDGSVANGNTVNKTITDEGIVLMKNNGVLPLEENSKVSPFGYRYLSPVYGGTGSGNVNTSKDYIVTPHSGLSKYFDINESVVEIMNDATPKEITSKEIKNAGKEESGNSFEGANTSILEFDPEIYKNENIVYDDSTAIVYIGRVAGEGGNLQSTAYSDGTAHALQLTTFELDTIKYAKERTDEVVVVVNSSNVMELSPIVAGEYEVDAIVWIGGPGSVGFESLADILVGEVNPSGRTVNIWDSDILSNPASANFSDRTYTNTVDTQIASNYDGLYFLEYEEGVYYGYRYYETASDLGYLDYDQAVTLPFGYGLSYTTFEQDITSISSQDDQITLTVEVSNTGKVDGKEVVQVYYTPPYTEQDVEYEVEKATKNLIAFDKVEVPAGETQEVSISFPKEDMASYNDNRENDDGTKGSWMLEEGEYVISLGKNSHEVWAEEITDIDTTIWYDNSNVLQREMDMQTDLDDQGNYLDYPNRANENTNSKYIAATNQFEDSTAYMREETTILSRSAWTETQPTEPEEKILSDERLEKASYFDVENDPQLGNHSDSIVYAEEDPVSNADNGVVLSDMRGKSYYDEAWDPFLDQIDYESPELSALLHVAAFTTGELSSIGKPRTVDHDGPGGFNLTGDDGGPDTTAYASQVVMASTWNVDLLYDFGEAIGQEALTIDYNGWYGPGLNLHRSAFNGRNYEYYSEDPILSGELGARAISGAADQGVVSYVKHFSLNDYEGPATALAVWATEQTIREIYLKPFEIALRDARMSLDYISDNEGTKSTKIMKANTAIMAAANMVNGEWSAANYNLLTNVLRGEWGFQGVVTTDMFLQNSPNITDKAFRAGSDLKMWFMPDTEEISMNSATSKETIRRAIKNISYAYANSNLMQDVAPGAVMSYSVSPWKVGVWIFNIVVLSFSVFMVITMLYRSRDEKENPEKYKIAKL